MGLLRAERRRAGLGGRELERPTRDVADPQRPHELEAGQPSQVLAMRFPQLPVLGLLADDGVLHNGVAEVVHHRRNGEDATHRSYSFFPRWFAWLATARYLQPPIQSPERQPTPIHNRASSCDRS